MPECFLGVDLGSSHTKGCLVNRDGRILADPVLETGFSFDRTAAELKKVILDSTGFKEEDIRRVVASGIGRDSLSYRTSSRTEISCLSKGIGVYLRDDTTVVDIGSQDIKVVKVSMGKRSVEFKMSRKCAAGTGAFLEEIAGKLRIPLRELNSIAEKTTHSREIGSYCTVFAATEILHRIREGTDIHEIVRGIYGSVVDRVLSIGQLGKRLALTGGLPGHHPVILHIFKEKTGVEPYVPPHPQTIVAFGAALFAAEIRG